MSKFPVAFKPLARAFHAVFQTIISLIMATFRLQVPATRRTGEPCGDLSPCPRRLQDIGLAFRWTSGRIFIWSGPWFVYRSTADRRNGRATWSIVALPPWPCFLRTLSASFQSPPSPSPSLTSDDFISLGCGLYYGVLSGVFRYLLV